MFSHGHRALAALAILGLTTMFAGCSDNATGPGPSDLGTDREDLQSLVTSDPAYADFFDLGMGFGSSSGAPSLPLGLSPIGELSSWHRSLEGMTQDVEIHIAGTTATIVAMATLTGKLVLMERQDGALVEFNKPLVDVAHRYATFERTGMASGRSSDRWRLVSISNVDIQSAVGGMPPTVEIESVLIEHGGTSLLISDPAVQMTRRDIERFKPGEEVTVTVTHSGGAPVGFLHYGPHRGGFRSRVPLEEQVDGSLRATFTVPNEGGIYYASIDLLTQGSLFETDPAIAPYDSNQWNLIYRVADHENEE